MFDSPTEARQQFATHDLATNSQVFSEPMKLIKSILKRLAKSISRHASLLKLKRELSSDTVQTRKVAEAIYEAIRDDVDVEERKTLERIEYIRSELAACTDLIEFTDYGAGSSGPHRTEEEMYAGVTNMRTVSRAVRASKPRFWGLVLYKLLTKFKPGSCVELGSCVGISAAYQASALKFNGAGSLVTMEGAESLAAIAEKTLATLELDNARIVTGRFQDKLHTVLEEEAPVDYIFIDGHHDEHATVKYFEESLPYLSESAIIVFDDISGTDGMRRAWNSIVDSSDVTLAFDLRAIGICLVDSSLARAQRFRFPML